MKPISSCKYSIFGLSAVIAVALTGCSITHQEVKTAYDSRKDQYEELGSEQSKRQETQQAPLVMINAPYLANKLVTLASDASLPEAFQRASSFERPRGSAGFSLPEVADMITKRYGIRVRIRPDVFLPARSLVMGGAEISEASSAATSNNTLSASQGLGLGNTPINAAAPLSGLANLNITSLAGPSLAAQSASSINNFGTTIDFDFNGSLTDYLHRISAFMGVSSEWDAANQELVFYRLVTKTFTLDTTPGKVKAISSVNKGASASSTGTSATGAAGVEQSSEADVWDAVEKTLLTLKTKAGSVVLNRGTRTITVVDTQEVVDLASRYIAQQNAVLGRQVLLSVKLIRVALNRNLEAGLDLNLAFKNFVNGIATSGLTSAPGSSILSGTSGSMTYTILDPSKSTFGSKLVAQFASGLGRIVDEYAQEIPVRNNRTVPLMDYTSQTYLSKTTPATGDGGAPGLETSTILSGTLFSLTPSIKDNESLVLSLGLDRSSDPTFTTISTGSSSTFQQVQLPNQRGIKLDTEIGMKNRETLIIMGLNKDSYGDSNSWGIAGASKLTTGNKELQFIIISPRIISGS